MKTFKELTEGKKSLRMDQIAALNKVLAKYGMEIQEITSGWFDLRGENSPRSTYFWWANKNSLWIQYEKGMFNIRGSVGSNGVSLAAIEQDLKAVKKIMGELNKAVPGIAQMK